MAIVSAPNDVNSNRLQLYWFPIFGDKTVEFLPKMAGHVYYKMKLLTRLKIKIEWEEEKYILSVTRSKLMIYERFNPYERLNIASISSLESTCDLIGVEIMDQEKIFVAYCSRRCAVVDYNNFDGANLKERAIELGEQATSIFYNSQIAMFGTVDSGKNSVAFYKLEELISPKYNTVVAEYDYLDYRSSNPVSCKGNRQIAYFDDISGTRRVKIEVKYCSCLLGYYDEKLSDVEQVEDSNCIKCSCEEIPGMVCQKNDCD